MFYGAGPKQLFAPEVIDLESLAGLDVAVEMKEGARLKGRLIAPEGKLIQNARVTASLRAFDVWIAETACGVDGAFELNGLPLDPAELKLSVSQAGEFQPASELTVETYELSSTFVLKKVEREAVR